MLAAGAGMMFFGSLAAQPVGQWDFNAGNLNPSAGAALSYRNSATQDGTQFGTTTALGIPDIGGQPANVMKFPAVADSSGGYSMTIGGQANGGGSLVNDWTLVLDVLFTPESSGKLRALLETDDGVFDPDAEFWVTAANAFGAKDNAGGTLAPNTWHRLAVVVSGTDQKITSYVDGIEVKSQKVPNLVDGRFALTPGGIASLFSDDTGETAAGYVNSIQLRDVALSKGQVLALAGPTADGIPAVLPPVPSGVDKWIPGGDFASRTTPVGAVLSVGSTTIQDSSISLSLNGVLVPGSTITRDGDLVTVKGTPAAPLTSGTEYTVTVAYTDSLSGAKTQTHKFTAALFFEDFESVVLGPNKDEGLAGDNVWTNTPPAGWVVDNSQFPAVVITPDNPDDDLDGFADLDGVTEWAGWGFAARDWWAEAAGNQRRVEFTLGEGTVAIADPDEWDDSGHLKSLFNSFLKTPEISLEGVTANSAFLKFASSWLPEAFDDVDPEDSTTGFPGDYTGGPEGVAINNQTAIITASYDGGAPVEVLKWDSKEGSPTFHGNFPNESVLIQLKNPAGAKKVVLSFELRLGANDWWWAVDNIVVSAGAQPPVVAEQPKSVDITEGQPLELTVVATGESLTYQWFKGQGTGRTAIDGATAATYSVAAATLADNGFYSVDVKNSVGTTKSDAVLVSVQLNLDGRIPLLSEDFEGLVLGPNVDESLAGEAVWTKTPPADWSIDDTGVPGVGTDDDGVTEWAGWSFATREWWATTAGNQRRAEFLKGVGAIAVADSDEWDDISHAAGNMNTYLKTKSISLAGIKPGSVAIKLDSSWRPEEPQRALIEVSFDAGATWQTALEYNSTPTNPNYRPDSVNETISIPVNNPAGATSMAIRFAYLETRNNWFWAFDNLVVAGLRASLFSENFEGLVLGPNVEEGITTGSGGAKPNVWTKTPPAGWSIDDSGVPGVGTDQDGVTEWAGWSFANREWWASTAGDQRRTEFKKGTGAVAIADSDEWDDIKPHAAGNMATRMTTTAINITGEAANTLYLKFDSSWRPEEPQKATITASFDGGAPVEVLRWESAEGKPFYHPDSVDETVNIPLLNPSGAKSLKLTFNYFDTLNNWFWAVDNLEVNSGPAVTPGASISYTTDASGRLVITYTGVLQSTTSLGGAFAPVLGATSPFTVNPSEGPAVNFYRASN